MASTSFLLKDCVWLSDVYRNEVSKLINMEDVCMYCLSMHKSSDSAHLHKHGRYSRTGWCPRSWGTGCVHLHSSPMFYFISYKLRNRVAF